MDEWPEPLTLELIRLRDEEHLQFSVIGKRLGRSKSACLGRYHRAKKTRFAPRRKRSGPGKTGAYHNIVQYLPSRTPFAPDSSVPNFANDHEHCEAVGAPGFPVLPRRSA